MSSEATLGEALSCHRVLLAEDDGPLRELLADYLELQGLEVVAVASGADALRELGGGHPPDLVVLDLKMPGIGGEEVLRRMKEDPRLARIPVAAMTGLRPGEFHFVADPDEFLAKPFDVEALASALTRMCAARGTSLRGGPPSG